MSLPSLFPTPPRALVARLDRLLGTRWMQATLVLATFAATWLYGTKVAHAAGAFI